MALKQFVMKMGEDIFILMNFKTLNHNCSREHLQQQSFKEIW